jgi:AAA+ superfamily predicted ATPase
MSPLVEPARWQPFGAGHIAPAGSLVDAALFGRLQAYKRDVAGTYRSLPPSEVLAHLPPGPCVASEKLDGETWFLHCGGDVATLLSPAGKAITGVPLTEEVGSLLGKWSGLLAGELYAARANGRPRVFDLHAAIGGAALAQTERLRFAAFDLLLDGEANAQRRPYPARVARLEALLHAGSRLHCARYQTVADAVGVAALFERIVTRGDAEGLVLHASDERTFKVKPEIAIDAAVIGYAGTDHGVSELLLALITPSGRYQSIGRVRTGSSRRESQELATLLAARACAFSPTADRRTMCRFVQPELVVEVRCNDLLAIDSADEPIRRMAFDYGAPTGWTPLGPSPSASMINPVFVRIRDDKQVQRPDVRFEQVTDLVHVAPELSAPAELPPSQILRREVYTKASHGGQAVRKLVAWATNKHDLDSRFPKFAVLFTDYSPEREQPLKTELRVASCVQNLEAFADDWLAANIKRGWVAASSFRRPEEDTVENTAALTPVEREPIAATTNHDDPVGPEPSTTAGLRLTITFARSASPTFPLVRRRLDTLAPLGSLTVAKDDKGREACLELTVTRGLVENARRIASLIAIVQRWKTSEVSLDGDVLGRQQLALFLSRLELVRRCWLRRKVQGKAACRRSCKLGCGALRIEASQNIGYSRSSEPPWFAVGSFDGERVFVDKQALRDQVANDRNGSIRLCPFFDPAAIAQTIDGLPDTLTADDSNWTLLFDYEGKPAWIWPHGQTPPSDLCTSADGGHRGVGISLGCDLTGATATNTPTGEQPAQRAVPPTRYSDVLGQRAAVEAARDLIELPLKHADIFLRIGAKPSGHGVILAGPPGTGKTLLARAVAGECDAHIEIVNGPALLSKWVGETEAAIRDVFERAQKFAPAVILFDEIDSIAPSRSAESAQHQVSVVAQLLVLLDGIEARGQIFVLATTNRPEHIDLALRRPGRFDQVVWMGLPDEAGRKDIFDHYLRGLKLDSRLTVSRLAADLARTAQGLTGADIAYLCQRAAMFCVKDAVGANEARDIAISRHHFDAALRLLTEARPAAATPEPPHLLLAG